MADIGLFFGSDEGNTETIAFRIQNRFGADVLEVADIADATQLSFGPYDKLILGIPTWDFGQIQSDWEEFWEDLQEISFQGKRVALFGLGDQFGYGDFFLDAMGMLYEVIIANGAEVVGFWSAEGYEFDASKAYIETDNCFVGLALDEDQQSELTTNRLNQWCREVGGAFGLTTPVQELDD